MVRRARVCVAVYTSRMAIQPWHEVERVEVHRGRIFTVRRDRLRSPVTGRDHAFDIVDAPDWVNVVAVTGEGRVLLIRQYRAGIRELTIEVPGGTVDPGETPIEAARRELLEETGYTSEDWTAIGRVE